MHPDISQTVGHMLYTDRHTFQGIFQVNFNLPNSILDKNNCAEQTQTVGCHCPSHTNFGLQWRDLTQWPSQCVQKQSTAIDLMLYSASLAPREAIHFWTSLACAWRKDTVWEKQWWSRGERCKKCPASVYTADEQRHNPWINDTYLAKLSVTDE